MRKPGGYAVWTSPEGPPRERDSITCGHCNAVVFVEPRQDPSTMGGFCRACMTHICQACCSEGGCTPFLKKLEAAEQRDRLVRAALGG